jgi:hypothetical protein
MSVLVLEMRLTDEPTVFGSDVRMFFLRHVSGEKVTDEEIRREAGWRFGTTVPFISIRGAYVNPNEGRFSRDVPIKDLHDRRIT